MSRWLAVVVVLGGGAVSAPSGARAQMFGTPVLQSAFANPGVTAGIDVASGESAKTYGVAAAWAPPRAMVQVSGGVALFDPDAGSARATWGLRVMAPIPGVGSPAFALAAFTGVGGTSASGAVETRIPVGVSAAYRRAIGAHRGIAAYVTPLYSWSRRKQDSVSVSHGLLRVAVGVDVAVMPGLGITVGYEGGARARSGDPGPAGGLFGVGLSYALHHRRTQ